MCVFERILHERSAPYDHNTNPFIEREQRTVLEGMLTAMYQSGAPASLWGECENHLIFTLNHIPSQKVEIEGRTEYWSCQDVLTGKRRPFRLPLLQAFGTACICYVPEKQRKGGKSPWQQRAFDGIIVGYADSMEAYRVWVIERRFVCVISFSFVIAKEGYFPFRDKKLRARDFPDDPTMFFPTFAALGVDAELKAFDFNDEELNDFLEGSDLPPLVESKTELDSSYDGVALLDDENVTVIVKNFLEKNVSRTEQKNVSQKGEKNIKCTQRDETKIFMPNNARHEKKRFSQRIADRREAAKERPLCETKAISVPSSVPLVPLENFGPALVSNLCSGDKKNVVAAPGSKLRQFIAEKLQQGLAKKIKLDKPASEPPPKTLGQAKKSPW